MTTKQRRALEALLQCSTQKEACKVAGVAPNTMKKYLSDDEFQAEYRKAFSSLVEEATRQARLSISPAILCLRAIVEDTEENSSARISAARSLMEYSIKFAEITDISQQLIDLEKKYAEIVERGGENEY